MFWMVRSNVAVGMLEKCRSIQKWFRRRVQARVDLGSKLQALATTTTTSKRRQAQGSSPTPQLYPLHNGTSLTKSDIHMRKMSMHSVASLPRLSSLDLSQIILSTAESNVDAALPSPKIAIVDVRDDGLPRLRRSLQKHALLTAFRSHRGPHQAFHTRALPSSRPQDSRAGPQVERQGDGRLPLRALSAARPLCCAAICPRTGQAAEFGCGPGKWQWRGTGDAQEQSGGRGENGEGRRVGRRRRRGREEGPDGLRAGRRFRGLAGEVWRGSSADGGL